MLILIVLSATIFNTILVVTCFIRTMFMLQDLPTIVSDMTQTQLNRQDDKLQKRIERASTPGKNHIEESLIAGQPVRR